MAEDDDTQYNDSNRAFLQAFLARSVLTFDEAKPILAAIITAHERREILAEDITEADFGAYINAANTAISPFDLEIRGTYHQTSRKRIYALVNATEDPIIQLATSHTADEISYLKRVLDAMFETYNTPRHEIMAITSMQAVRLCKPPAEAPRETQNGSATQGSAGQSLTMVQAEKMLKSLVEEGWFEKSAKGFYSLSPRALMELRGWLLDTYNDVEDEEDEDQERAVKIKRCLACKEIITTGQRCPKLTCPCRLHDVCRQNFFRAQKSTKCSLCTTDWRDDNIIYVGERVVTAAEKKLQSKRRSGPGPNPNHRPSNTTTSAVEVDESAEEGEG